MFETLSADEAEQRYGVSSDVEYPYADFADEQEIRLYPAGLHVTGDLVGETDTDWSPYNVIVDGDLTVDGDIDWWDYGSGNFFLVTGNVSARNVFLEGCPTFVVRGDLNASGGVQGHHGDDGGYLVVQGALTAPIVVSTLYFNLDLAAQPDAILAADPYRCTVAVDFSDDDLAEVLQPELLDGDRADERKITEALRAGRPVLRPTAVPAHLAALAELDRLLAAPGEVTALDLSGRKLRAFPHQVLAMPNLRTLDLSGNDQIDELPDGIGNLAALEELDLSGLSLTRLPGRIADLSRLRVLDISSNRFAELPEQLGALANLTKLRADNLRCPLPESVARLARLEELELYNHDPGPGGAGVRFPQAITALPKLRVLRIAMTPLAEIPDELLNLTALEELTLDGSLGHVDRLPDLSRLPRLRVLRMDGRRANRGPYPKHQLFDAVWRVGTLEVLGLDRWGPETATHPQTKEEIVLRPALTSLPDDAFARLPRLREVDLSFNALQTLPESFYTLTELTSVDLRYTKLDQSTVERLTQTFPRVRLDLRNVASANITAADVDDPHWQQVHEAVAEAARQDNSESTAAALQQALALCAPGTRFSEYDQLYAYYRLCDVLGHLAAAASGEQAKTWHRRLAEHGREALRLVPPPGAIWHFTEFGAFQEEVTRRTGNAVAWSLMRLGDLGEALSTVDRALAADAGTGHDYIRDTKVRILLAMGRREDAYLIVDQVLARDPDFGDFGDLRADPDFLAWRRRHT